MVPQGAQRSMANNFGPRMWHLSSVQATSSPLDCGSVCFGAMSRVRGSMLLGKSVKLCRACGSWYEMYCTGICIHMLGIKSKTYVCETVQMIVSLEKHSTCIIGNKRIQSDTSSINGVWAEYTALNFQHSSEMGWALNHPWWFIMLSTQATSPLLGSNGRHVMFRWVPSQSLQELIFNDFYLW